MKTKETSAYLRQALKSIEELEKGNRVLRERLQIIKDQYLLGFIQFDNEDDISLLDNPYL